VKVWEPPTYHMEERTGCLAKGPQPAF